MEKRDKIIKAVIMVTITLIVLLIAILSLVNFSCAFQDNEPVRDLSMSSNIASTDFKALANFAGFLQHNDNNRNSTLYLPFELESVKVQSTSDFQTLTLKAECGQIELLIKPENNNYKVAEISVEFRKTNKGFHSCRVSESIGIIFNQDFHYFCDKRKTLACQGNDNNDATETTEFTLVISGIEFETYGDVGDFRNGIFTRRQTRCD